MKHLVIATALVLTSLTAFAQSKDAKDSDKLDLKKLEDKYWAAKDTDFSVVQNRLYTKDHRVYLNLGYGNMVNDAYSSGKVTNAELGYYFSERWGMSLNYESYDSSPNESTEAFIKQYGTQPDFNKSTAYKSASVIWVPFYAKMSFLDRSIVYFDMQFSAGVGLKDYTIVRNVGDEKKSAFGYHFNFSQQLFFANNWALRLDLKNEWSNQERKKSYVSGAAGDLSSNTINDTSLILGLTYFFGSGGQK